MSIGENLLNVFIWAANGITWGLSKAFGKPIDPMFGYVGLIFIILWITYLLIRTFEQYYRYWLIMSTVFYLLVLFTYVRLI